MHWTGKWQPTPVFLPGESQGWGSLVGSIYRVTQSQTRLKRLSSSSSVHSALPVDYCFVGITSSSSDEQMYLQVMLSSKVVQSCMLSLRKKVSFRMTFSFWLGRTLGKTNSFNVKLYSFKVTAHLCCCCLVPELCLPLCHSTDCSLPGSSVHGISQARILEWVAISFSKGSFWPRDQTHVSCIGRRILYHWSPCSSLHRAEKKSWPFS